MTTTRDLDTRSEIHDLVIDFYREIVFDPVLGPVFDEVAEVDWAAHIPRLIDYWARVLLKDPSYDGFILRPHQHVHALQRFELDHFDRWYALFTASVDQRWQGPFAEQAKGHAARIAATLARRILGEEWTPPARPARDLDSPEEIAEMVRRFYADVAQDDLLGPMFNDVAKVDWSEHLPKLTAFWCRALLDQPGYSGNPFRAHALVHQQRSFTAAHFERWLELFHETLELGWAGPRATRAGELADNVARVHAQQLSGPRSVLHPREGEELGARARVVAEASVHRRGDGA